MSFPNRLVSSSKVRKDSQAKNLLGIYWSGRVLIHLPFVQRSFLSRTRLQVPNANLSSAGAVLFSLSGFSF